MPTTDAHGPDPQWLHWQTWLSRNPDPDDWFEWLCTSIESDLDDAEIHQLPPTGGGIDVSAGSYSRKMTSQSQLRDLLDQGLLRLERHGRHGDVVYTIPADAWSFRRWRNNLPSAIEQTVNAAFALVDDDGFAARHPDAAVHLRGAFELLAVDDDLLEVPAITEIGMHLRAALIDTASAAVDLDVPDEQLIEVLKPVRVAAVERADLATAALVNLVEAVFRLDHGIHHVRDEINQGHKPAAPATIRRAARLTAVACFELDQAPRTPAATAPS